MVSNNLFHQIAMCTSVGRVVVRCSQNPKFHNISCLTYVLLNRLLDNHTTTHMDQAEPCSSFLSDSENPNGRSTEAPIPPRMHSIVIDHGSDLPIIISIQAITYHHPSTPARLIPRSRRKHLYTIQSLATCYDSLHFIRA